MSFEFKMKKWRHGKKSKRYNGAYDRSGRNNSDSKHLSMRARESSNTTYKHYVEKGFTDYREMQRFLKARIGKSVDDVFSEFVKEMKKHNRRSNIKDIFYSFFNNAYLNERWWSGFYIGDGIIRYKKREPIKPRESAKQADYNKETISKDVLKEVNSAWINFRGPKLLGKLWVSVKGNVMLLPVYIVDTYKFDNRYMENPDVFRLYARKPLEYLQGFTLCYIVGIGSMYSFQRMHGPYSYATQRFYYIVNISDIERYKKERFSERTSLVKY